MKNSIRILTAAVLCALLAGCGKEQAQPQSDESVPVYEINVADLIAGTTAPPQIIATGTIAQDAAAETVTEAAVTDADGQPAAGSEAAQENPASAEIPAEVQSGDGYEIAQIFDADGFAAVSCTGTVTAPDGLNLRESPGTGGKKITLLEDGTAVEVLGLKVSGNLYDLNDRWLKVRADGQEGYALAEYIAVECSTPAAQLSEQERAALGTVLYYQAMHLYPDYHRHAGPRGEYLDQFKDGFCRVVTKGNANDALTLENLKKEFHRYFSADCENDLDRCYIEDMGKLYVLVGYGDNVSTDYVLPNRMTAQSDTELKFDILVHHHPEFVDEEFPEWVHDTFRLVYEDGSWKTAEIKEEY